MLLSIYQEVYYNYIIRKYVPRKRKLLQKPPCSFALFKTCYIRDVCPSICGLWLPFWYLQSSSYYLVYYLTFLWHSYFAVLQDSFDTVIDVDADVDDHIEYNTIVDVKFSEETSQILHSYFSVKLYSDIPIWCYHFLCWGISIWCCVVAKIWLFLKYVCADSYLQIYFSSFIVSFQNKK